MRPWSHQLVSSFDMEMQEASKALTNEACFPCHIRYQEYSKGCQNLCMTKRTLMIQKASKRIGTWVNGKSRCWNCISQKITIKVNQKTLQVKVCAQQPYKNTCSRNVRPCMNGTRICFPISLNRKVVPSIGSIKN